MGRPKTRLEGRPPAVQVRLEESEYECWERLVASRQEELRDHGVRVTGSDVLRWLILREATARGLIQPKPAPSKLTAKPAAPAKPASPAARSGSTRPKAAR